MKTDHLMDQSVAMNVQPDAFGFSDEELSALTPEEQAKGLTKEELQARAKWLVNRAIRQRRQSSRTSNGTARPRSG